MTTPNDVEVWSKVYSPTGRLMGMALTNEPLFNTRRNQEPLLDQLNAENPQSAFEILTVSPTISQQQSQVTMLDDLD